MDSIENVISQIVPDQDVKSVPFITQPDVSLRFKVTDRCSWNCSFCHKEGGWDNMVTAGWGEDEVRVFNRFRDYGYNEVHFTGGEPTLNPNLPDIIKELVGLGYAVKSTSILAGKPGFLLKCAENGLSGVNVSVHGDFSSVDVEKEFVPDDVLSAILGFQIGRQREQVRNQILSLVRGLNVLKGTGVNVKANTVISSFNDLEKARRVHAYSKLFGLGLRFLPDLTPSSRDISFAAISVFLKSIGAKLTSVKRVAGSSDATAMFIDTDGYRFGVKQIDDVFLDSMCSGCKTMESGNCTEKYYGIRLEKVKSKNDPYTVRLCLHEQASSVVMPFDQFLRSPQFREILAKKGSV